METSLLINITGNYGPDMLNIYEPLDKSLSKEDLANIKLTIDDVKRIY